MVSTGDMRSMMQVTITNTHYNDIYDLLMCLHKIRFQHGLQKFYAR